MKLELTITETDLVEAAKEACRASWASIGYEGSWDENCDSKEHWLRDELETLSAALNHLGIRVVAAQ